MSCCAVARNGRTSAGDVLRAFSITRTTTTAALQSYRVANLAAVGSSVAVYATFHGTQDGGERFGRFNFWWDASRNGVGVGELVQGTIANGYTDPAALPFTTPGFPPTWAIPALVLVGNIVNLTWAGAAAQTVRWRISGTRSFVGGATP
jgi:hypothetical protein